MPLFKRLAAGLFARRAGKRLGRVIPNPFMRYAVMAVATSLAPRVCRGIKARAQARKLDGMRLDAVPSTRSPVTHLSGPAGMH